MSATAANIGQATRVDDIGGRFDPWLLGTQRGRSETALRLTYQF